MDPITTPEDTIWSEGPYRVVLKRPRPDKKHVVLQSPDVVHILPVTSDGTIILLRQARYGAGCMVLEAPAGGIDPGETADEAARRELREEIGYGSEDLVRVGTPGAFSSPGVISERSTLFVARGCAPVEGEHEDIATIRLTPDAALALVTPLGTDAQPVADPEAVVADVKTMLLLTLARSAALI